MTRRKPKKRPTSYFWALEPGPTTHLSDDALDGLEYATQLADDARNRRHQMLRRELQLPPLTITDLAEACGRSPQTVRRCITRARTELNGKLSDAGIYYRRRREKQLLQRPQPTCVEAGCTNLLPRGASAGRQYCDRHRTPAARTRRSRANHAR